MEIYYDIEVKDEITNGSVSFWADSFSVDENRILRVKSREYGDVTVEIKSDKRLTVRDVIVTDEWDELMDSMDSIKRQ